MVLAIDDHVLADNEAHVVRKRLFDAEGDLSYAYFGVGGESIVVVDPVHTPKAAEALEQARALDAVAEDDSENEPPDFTVDDGFDV